ncbi:metallophosphoesterase family protein [Latilactobacillus sakei]
MANQVDYRDPTPNNFPQDYDLSKVDSRVKLRSESIKHKQKGKQTREAMYQALEISSVTAGEAKETAINTASRQDKTEKIVDEGIGAFTKDSEVVIARDGHTNLLQKEQEQDDRLQTVERHTDISSNRAIAGFLADGMAEVDGPTPSYYQTRISEIAQMLPDESLNIGFITDNHYQMDDYAPHSLGHYANIAALSRSAKVDAIVAGGDNTNGGVSRQRTLTEVRQATSTLFNRTSADTDVFFMLGNHDTGIGQNENKTRDTTVSPEELKDFYRTKTTVYGEVRDGDSLYGFKDYENQKIRVIWLNSYDLPYTVNSDGTYKYDFLKQSAFQNEQLKWIVNAALKLPSKDWKVMIFSHAPLAGSFDSQPGQTPIVQFNSNVLIGVLNAFQNGTVYSVSEMESEIPVQFGCDFSEQGKGTIIAFVSGHVHQDGQMTYQGINCIQTTCSLCSKTNPQRVANSITEDAWDIFSVDTKARTIRIYRLGYGSDRNYTY